jgi:hypothetical protein
MVKTRRNTYCLPTNNNKQRNTLQDLLQQKQDEEKMTNATSIAKKSCPKKQRDLILNPIVEILIKKKIKS